MPYRAPTSELAHCLDDVVDFGQVQGTERFGEATQDVALAILDEAGKLANDAIAPAQRQGDLHPVRLENGVVRTSPGYIDAYRAIAEGGWVGLPAASEYGGMGLPQTLNTAVTEFLSGACLALAIKPLLSQGQIEALEAHASEELRATYLPKLVAGTWSGTMNLTEPQAGSDVGALRATAEPKGDGSWAVTGQKIYISWGDSDLVENVCHLVLARTPGAPAGTKGISLFLVPKILPIGHGALGPANNLKVVSLEEKLGLHGSPTAVMSYEGASGWLVGEEMGGMAAMFTMMNSARLGVGAQGVGVAEAATQHAVAFARERRQGKAGGTGAIIEHPDVKRMLATMKAETFAARSIALACAVAIDMGHATESEAWRARAALLTPIAKAFGTDVGCRVADLGIQVHGGMGYVEETGAAQFFRDVRVCAIYEGTNGIQAIDLVSRKLADGGEAAYRLIDEIEADVEKIRDVMPEAAQAVWGAAETLREVTEWLVEEKMEARLSGAHSYLMAFARVLGGWYHLKSAFGGDPARRAVSDFYIGRLLPEHEAHIAAIRIGGADLQAITPDHFA
ncbi:MAG: acyl-CoA dehydrogenase [Pseudomonadota bacterium]